MKPDQAAGPYQPAFDALLQQIVQARQAVFAQVNTALIDLYWSVGQAISEKVNSEAWGKGVVKELAGYIARHAPEVKGFSDKNLWRMKQFYEAYQGDGTLAPMLREQPWSHNLAIFSRCKTGEERQFYLQLARREGYTFRELDRQISASLFERTMLGSAKLSTPLRVLNPQVEAVFKDHYVLEFLGLPPEHREADLQKALIRNMKAFILELGSDFIFVGEEYRVQVGSSDFYLDLLFFHRGLSALVAFELKVEQFQPEHLGKLNFYLEALDRDVKKPHENPSIGVLLCSDANEEVVEYALSRSLSPTLIAQYQLQLPDKKLLQAHLHQLLHGEPPTDQNEP